MYKIENLKEKIYLYDVVRGGYTHCFATLNDLLKFLATKEYNASFSGVRYYNSYLESVNMGNDKYCEELAERLTYSDKEYMFVDEYNRIIDPRIYKSKIEYYRDNNICDYVDLWKTTRKSRYGYYNNSYDFRSGPVPNVGSKPSCCKVYRHPHTINERRQNSDVEMRQFVRPCRCGYNLPSSWDDLVRSRAGSKSWKDCTKKRKQWMR